MFTDHQLDKTVTSCMGKSMVIEVWGNLQTNMQHCQREGNTENTDNLQSF